MWNVYYFISLIRHVWSTVCRQKDPAPCQKGPSPHHNLISATCQVKMKVSPWQQNARLGNKIFPRIEEISNKTYPKVERGGCEMDKRRIQTGNIFIATLSACTKAHMQFDSIIPLCNFDPSELPVSFTSLTYITSCLCREMQTNKYMWSGSCDRGRWGHPGYLLFSFNTDLWLLKSEEEFWNSDWSVNVKMQNHL